MEDQQSPTSDLTDVGAKSFERRPECRRPRRRAAGRPSRSTAGREASENDTDDEQSEDLDAQVRHDSRRWITQVLVGLATTLLVAAGALAGTAAWLHVSQRADTTDKESVAHTAAQAITTLWTYTPDDMEQLVDRSAGFLSGDLESGYRRYIDAIAPTNKQAQVTNKTEVVGIAIESLTGREATAIVYTNSASTSPLTNNIPSTRYLSYRITLHEERSRWLVTRMTTITSLDLTPQL